MHGNLVLTELFFRIVNRLTYRERKRERESFSLAYKNTEGERLAGWQQSIRTGKAIFACNWMQAAMLVTFGGEVGEFRRC